MKQGNDTQEGDFVKDSKEKKLTVKELLGFALKVQRTRNTGVRLKDCITEVKEAEKEARGNTNK